MCGISGIVDLAGKRPIDEALLKDINDTMVHRGPDGDGLFVEPGVGFGHRRLSIIDLEGGKQPLFNEDYTVVVTYNGEIYNFREIEIELKAKGHVFRTRCDTEVIVHAWEEWGVNCVDRFNGMFAFAIWDKNAETLFLARDRLGIKPLHYTLLDDGQLIFASELKAIKQHPAVTCEIDPQAVEEYFAFAYVPDPKTIYKGIHKLEAGCRLLIKRGRPEINVDRYWDVPLDQAAVSQTMEDAAEQVRQGLFEAVDRRLLAEVPLGAFLSGGIDSSAVVAMMSKSDIDVVRTCSIGFKEKRYDESEFADMVAEAKQTVHHKEVVESGDYSLIDKLIGVYDEPYADSSAIPTYRVCELARRQVTVALSGDGGDENYIGYRRYRLFAAEDRVRQNLPSGIRKNIFGPLGRYYPKLDWAPRFVRGKTTFQSLARNASDGYRHAVNTSQDDIRDLLFNAKFRCSLNGHHASSVFDRYLDGKEFDDNLRMAQYLDFKTYLPGDILTKVDRASMAHSLEVRVPFLDYQFVEATAAIPTELKLAGAEGKAVLKKALEPNLPHEVLYRTKMGFAVPLDIWFRDSLKERMAQAVAGERMKDSGYFNPAALDRVVRDHHSGARDYSATLWSLLMFERFLASQ